MTFGQKHNLDKVKHKMIFEKTVFYDILYLSIIQIKKGGIESVNKSKRGIRAGTVERMYISSRRRWNGVAKSIDEEISRDIAENEKKKAENADKDGEFLNGFGVDPEEPDTNFYKPEDDATENVSPEEESENVDQ